MTNVKNPYGVLGLNGLGKKGHIYSFADNAKFP